MFKNIFITFSRKKSLHKNSFSFFFICFLLFSFTCSIQRQSEQNTLPRKYLKNIKTEEIEENTNLFFLSTRDGYLHALDENKQEIWKTYLEQELMTTTTSKQISKNVTLFPFNEKLYIIENTNEGKNSKFTPFDVFIKDLVKEKYVPIKDFTLLGKTKSTMYIIDMENGEILQKIDEDSNFVHKKKIYIRQKNRRKKTLTVLRVDYILNCLGLKEEEKYWNATYSEILVKKGTDVDNWDNFNYFIEPEFINKIVNDYKNNNLENSAINYGEVMTAYAYFDREDIPNIKIYDRCMSNALNSSEKKEMIEERKYLDDYNRYKYENEKILIDENYEKNKKGNRILNYLRENLIFILIIIILCLIIFFILFYYNRKTIKYEIKKEIEEKEKKEEFNIIEKEEKNKEENKDIKPSNSDKEEKDNTNITEESKDFLEKEKKDIEEMNEKTISEENKTISINSRDNNINNIIEEKPKEKSKLRNAIWDSDSEDKDENNEKSKNTKNQITNTQIKKSEKEEKSKKRSKYRNAIWDDDEDEITEKSKTVKEQTKSKQNNKRKEKTKTKEKPQDNEGENEEEEEESDEEGEKNEIKSKNTNKKLEQLNNIKLEQEINEIIKPKKKATRLDTDFENLEKIGEGGYGLVLKGTHRIDKYIYAIKIINISGFKNNSDIDDIINEANKMSMIKDKYIVNYNICWYEDNLGTAEKFYVKKEESSSSSLSADDDDENSKKSNISTKLIKKESKINHLRSFYFTSFRDDSKLLNNNTNKFSMKYKKKYFMILMEYCDGNTLEDLIQKHVNDSKPIDRRLIYNYTKQILKGLKVLHRNGIIHSDIKPGNIFLKKVGEIEQIKIGDFGMAMLKKGVGKLNSKDIKGFTPLYSAPEQKNKKGTYNEKIDIYACGLILYELIGCFATKAEKYKAFDDLKENGTIFDYIENEYKEESELIKIMTKKDYDERPSAEEILGNNIFKELGKIVNK